VAGIAEVGADLGFVEAIPELLEKAQAAAVAR
jgi:hypothetical protein